MSTYRDQELARLENVRLIRLEAIRRFFDTGLLPAERLKAARSCGTFSSTAEVERATAIFRDADEAPSVRAAALNGLSNALASDESLALEALAQLGDRKAPIELRVVALSTLQSSQFGSNIAPRLRPAYLNLLRGLLDDEAPGLKRSAAEYLALERDEYLQRRLEAGLRDPQQAIVPPELAIQYLANDLHAELLPVLRDIARNPPNAAAKKEALRNLGVDAESRDFLVERVLDAGEKSEVRHVSLVALSQTAPDVARHLAQNIIMDNDTDDELRAAMLNTLAHTPASAAAPRNVAFDTRVAELSRSASSPELLAMAARYSRNQDS